MDNAKHPHPPEGVRSPRARPGSTTEIADTAKRTGRTRSGPIPLPTRIERFTVNRSRMSTRSRASSSRSAPTSGCSTSSQPTPQTVDALMKLDLAAGVDVEIKLA
jgi:small subunit ribosomal protein S10